MAPTTTDRAPRAVPRAVRWRRVVPRVAASAALLLAACDRRIDVDFNYAFEIEDHAWADRLLAEGADIDARYLEAEGFTTLMMAAHVEGRPGGVEWLLKRGADPNIASFRGRTALHVAASAGSSEKVRLLLAAGARVDARTRSGDTPLAVARERGHADVERLIVEAGGGH